jgi:hypothetical protein
MTQPNVYFHHTVTCGPRTFSSVADRLAGLAWSHRGGEFYGAWRSQIGRPRDELNVMTGWTDSSELSIADELIQSDADVLSVFSESMVPTLRPTSFEPPRRQGNYAFRWFELDEANIGEFLSLCDSAWPGFESAYDSQVIGLWRAPPAPSGLARALLLTRRPDLAMWERSKIPANDAEAEVRRKLSRRYDLCDATWVYTTTLLSADDGKDKVRWT